jgi:fructose-1,6-bisphosphatase I
MQCPKKGAIYSINEGNAQYWDEPITKYVHSKKFPEKGKKAYSLRYIGSMVADVHRTLLYGGVFMYPGDKRAPEGKLRVLYEVFPMSFIMEKAGGKSTTGKKRILEITPKKIHERSPIILGSAEDVEEIEALYKEFGDKI